MSAADLREQNRIAGQSGGETKAAVQGVRDKIEAARIATVSAIGTSQRAIVDKVGAGNTFIQSARDKIEAARIAQVSAIDQSKVRGSSDADRIVTAIRNKDFSVKVTVNGAAGGVGAGAVKVKTGQTVNRADAQDHNR